MVWRQRISAVLASLQDASLSYTLSSVSAVVLSSHSTWKYTRKGSPSSDRVSDRKGQWGMKGSLGKDRPRIISIISWPTSLALQFLTGKAVQVAFLINNDIIYQIKIKISTCCNSCEKQGKSVLWVLKISSENPPLKISLHQVQC